MAGALQKVHLLFVPRDCGHWLPAILIAGKGLACLERQFVKRNTSVRDEYLIGFCVIFAD
jgi:hypothetical protein